MPYYVTMTDKFMSDWGHTAGRKAKFVVECETTEEAFRIEAAALRRREMRYVRIVHASRPPRFRNAHVSLRKFEELGTIWTGEES